MNYNVIMRISLMIALAITAEPVKAGWANKLGFLTNSIRHAALNRKRLAFGATGTVFAAAAVSQTQSPKPTWGKYHLDPHLGSKLYIGLQGGPGSRGISYWEYDPQGWHRKFEPKFGEGATFLDCLKEKLKCAWYTNPDQEIGSDAVKFASHETGPGIVVEYDVNKCDRGPREKASSLPFIEEDDNGNTKSHSMLCTGMRGRRTERYFFVDGEHSLKSFNRCPNCYHQDKNSSYKK